MVVLGGGRQGGKGSMNVKRCKGGEDGRRASEEEEEERQNSATASEAHQTV